MRPFFVVFIATIVCFSCLSYTKDELQVTGLLGLWEIESFASNENNSISETCCKYVELIPDAIKTDLTGKCMFFNGLEERQGTFIVNQENKSIELHFGNQIETYSYTLNHIENAMLLSPFQSDSAIKKETWKKIN